MGKLLRILGRFVGILIIGNWNILRNFFFCERKEYYIVKNIKRKYINFVFKFYNDVYISVFVVLVIFDNFGYSLNND